MEIEIRNPIDVIILDGDKEIKVQTGHKVVEDILRRDKIIIAGDDYTVPISRLRSVHRTIRNL